MRTPTALAVALLASLLYACGSTSTTTTPSSQSSAGAQTTATNLPSETTSPLVTEPAEVSPSTESPETDGTDGITLEEDQLIPPIAPDTPTLEVSSEGLVIRWRGTGPSDLVNYLIYKRRAPSDPWTQVAEVLPEGDNLGDYSYVIAEESEHPDEYAIVAVDVDGNRSLFAVGISVDQ